MTPADRQWLQRMVPPSLYREIEKALDLDLAVSEAPLVCVHMDYADEGWPFMCGMGKDEEVHHPGHGHVPKMRRMVP